jgi:hypothetical protein
MKKIILSVFTLSFFIAVFTYGQNMPAEPGLRAITTEAIQAQLGFLASDWTEGRMAGEKGEFLSADYIASMLKLYGLKPGGDNIQNRSILSGLPGQERSFFQNFVLLKTIPGDEQILKVKTTDGKMVKTTSFTLNVDFRVRPSDLEIEIEAPVIFAGFGIIDNKLKYNDFSKLDVKGKFILKIAGFPKFIKESLSPAEMESSETEMESTLKSMGAIGIIEFNPLKTIVGIPERRDFMIMSPSEGNPVSGKPNASFSIPGKKSPDNLIRIEVSVKTANEILKGTEINIDDYIKKADANETNIISSITDKSIYLKTEVVTTQVNVRNIVGIIEGNNPEQVIVIGAHYDHLGMNKGNIWNGADDNGSGTVGAMTLAKAIMQTGKKPEKTILVALWTAEEEGLLGSRYWIQNPTCPLKNVLLNVNFDMISRYISENEQKKVTLTYTNSYPGFKDITVANLRKYGIDLIVDYQPSADPPGGTDHRSFVAAGIPIMRFKPGHREEYHTPADELSTIDWDIMEKIIRISFLDIWELANTNWQYH